ncbi:hypothetical protein CAEBREN_31285 [Caenorhabditis brenneri]|uniref:F-box domain-containing protein n=1 Tax=Caenorhabditis brenneri TaxID=135651 RepID=G0N3G7_CAEBE|nr:hypothetical protein CAEBREN_31285 [Caenorhabditis brenneri]
MPQTFPILQLPSKTIQKTLKYFTIPEL